MPRKMRRFVPRHVRWASGLPSNRHPVRNMMDALGDLERAVRSKNDRLARESAAHHAQVIGEREPYSPPPPTDERGQLKLL